jgi:folylpolyglutamate synthase/dihydropteroate synthase
VTIPLRGRFQRENAAMAGIAAQYLNELGFCITEGSIRHGLATVEWPGRFQTVVADPETIVDGAHNPYAGAALAATIRECLPGRAINLVIGMSREKDARSFIAELAPLAHQLVFTQARHARSWAPADLAGVAESLGYRPVIACSPQEAITRAWASQPVDGATIVTGSLFLVGDVLEWLVREGGAEDGAE